MEENSSIALDGRTDCREAAKILVLGCSGQLCLFTQRLESELYNDAEIYAHLAGLCSGSRNTRIRIIAHDTRVAGNQGHRLIHLAQRLPTFVQIRTTATPEHKQFRESWLIADDGAYLRIRNPERWEGFYELDNKLETRGYLEDFDEAWETSVPDQNTRRLGI